MSLHNMMFNGMSGINSMAGNMAVLGDNIANVNTVSYKNLQTTFQNVITSSQERFGEVGNGSQIQAISKNFRPGALESTTRATDMAVSGKGFFMVQNQVGETLYTRDGQFDLKEEDYTPEGFFNLVTPAGYRVQGVDLQNGNDNGVLADVLVQRQSPPQPTEKISLALNLQSRGAGVAGSVPLYQSWQGGETPPLAQGAYDYKTTMQAFDERGQSFALDVFFDHTENPNEREFLITHDPALDRRQQLDGSRYNSGEEPEKGAGALLYGKLIFSSTGELVDIQAWEVPPGGDVELWQPVNGEANGNGNGNDNDNGEPGEDEANDNGVNGNGGDNGNGNDNGVANNQELIPGANWQEKDPSTGHFSFNFNLSGTGDNLAASIDFGTTLSLQTATAPGVAKATGAGVTAPGAHAMTTWGQVYDTAGNPVREGDAIIFHGLNHAGEEVTSTYEVDFDERVEHLMRRLEEDFDATALIKNGRLELQANQPGASHLTVTAVNYLNAEGQSPEESEEEPVAQPFGAEGVGFNLQSGDDTDLSPLRTTNYATSSATVFQDQDGYGQGALQTVSVKPDGTIFGNYSNGQSHDLAQVMLADFANYRGLIPGSHNTYEATEAAGAPVIGTPGSGTFGEVLGNSLEGSNVDLGRQFVDLTMTQRIFQANSKSITTADEIHQTLMRLK